MYFQQKDELTNPITIEGTQARLVQDESLERP
jgi:hypothetical protein